MELEYINGLAVVGAAISSFLIGSVWYSKMLFGRKWMALVGLTEAGVEDANMGKIFGFAFIFQLILASFLAVLMLSDISFFSSGLYTGLTAGSMIFCGIAVAYLFAQKRWSLIFIDGGYQVVAMVIMGIIIGYFG